MDLSRLGSEGERESSGVSSEVFQGERGSRTEPLCRRRMRCSFPEDLRGLEMMRSERCLYSSDSLSLMEASLDRMREMRERW